MRKTAGAMLLLAAMLVEANAATRVYDVDVYKNVNGWTPAYPYNYVQQSFICDTDSAITYAEFFVGAGNSDGEHYHFEIQASGQAVFEGNAQSHLDSSYRYIRAQLSQSGSEPLVKGNEYVLKITYSGGDPINYYYSDQNPYKYGILDTTRGLGQHTYNLDLCARVEGSNRANDRGLVGVNTLLHWIGFKPDTLHVFMNYLDSAKVGVLRQDFFWSELQPTQGMAIDWTGLEALVDSARGRGMKVIAILHSLPDWVSSRVEAVNGVTGETTWARECPPRNLYAAGSANYWRQFVQEVAQHFQSDSISLEIGNEPNYWRNPDTIFGYRAGTSLEDSITIVESLYARACDVAIEAAHSVDPSIPVFVGALGGVALEDLEEVLGPRLVAGKSWLRGYYTFRQNANTAGVSVHPYQYQQNSSAPIAGFSPELFDQDVDTMRAIMDAHGDTSKALWASEWAWAEELELSNQAAMAVPEAYLYARTSPTFKYYDHISWWAFWGGPGFDNGSVWIKHDTFTHQIIPKPVYYAFKQMADELGGLRLNGRMLTGNAAVDSQSLVYELEDTADGKKTWVGWQNYPGDAQGISVSVPARCQTLDTVQLARNGSPPHGNATAATDGWLRLTLDTVPRYIRETSEPSRPDLIVDSVWTEPEILSPDQPVAVKARVRNIGNAGSISLSASRSLLALVCCVNGDTVSNAVSLAEIRPGGFRDVTVVNSWMPNQAGDYLLKVSVNPKRVVELNFDNNAFYLLKPVR